MDKDDFGNRMKSYEAPSTARRAFKGQPLIARLDGKNFHNFTKGLKRPYDTRLSTLMSSVMTELVDRFQCSVGYTQSDEITLAWFYDSTSKAEYAFGGRFQKMDSVIASTCSVLFNKQIPQFLPEKTAETPVFDCRSFVVPNLLEAYHTFLWRQQDCTKNAISMAAQSMFSHKELQGRNGSQMQEMMFSEHGANFNEYPAFFRRGTFARRVRVWKPMDADLEKNLAAKGVMMPTGPIERSEIQVSNAWLTKLEDPVSYLFKSGSETYRAAPDDDSKEP